MKDVLELIPPNKRGIRYSYPKNNLGLEYLIKGRRSLRMPFDPKRPVAKKDIHKILEAGSWAPTAHNMQNFEVVVVDDKKLLDAIWNIDTPVSPIFIKENYAQLSFSEEEWLKKKVGILGTMFPPSWRSPEAKKGKITDNDDDRRPAQTSPTLLIVLYDPKRRAPASEGDFLGIISLGCVMENMWLMANSLGVGFHIMSVLGSGTVEKKVKSILKIPSKLNIAFAVRLGYPVVEPKKFLRVRRDVEDFTYYNQFGKKGID